MLMFECGYIVYVWICLNFATFGLVVGCVCSFAGIEPTCVCTSEYVYVCVCVPSCARPMYHCIAYND